VAIQCFLLKGAKEDVTSRKKLFFKQLRPGGFDERDYAELQFIDDRRKTSLVKDTALTLYWL
jgi:hypothetical protein